jgi:poly(ADP-ribose) glycohydrolase ARH3
MANELEDKFAGSMLGGMVGDFIGAAVEAESPGYIRKTFKNVDDILALKTVPEILSGDWEVGRFTDDTQLTLAVAEWLIRDASLSGRELLANFCRVYEPWRHYASGTRLILESFPQAGDRWPELATAMFPQGSYGNGSAMRVAPVGLMFHNDLRGLIQVARTSSSVTHSHFLALQGAALQATAVAVALKSPFEFVHFMTMLTSTLSWFEDLGQDTSVYKTALARICEGMKNKISPLKMSSLLGNGIKVQEAVPMAIYCYCANPHSFEKAVESAIFLGGDTDTIACMTGAISGAALGANQIPSHWLKRSAETDYTPARIQQIASKLYQRGFAHKFRLQK